MPEPADGKRGHRVTWFGPTRPVDGGTVFVKPPDGEATPQPEAADGSELIAAERRRQTAVEGWTPEHDDEHSAGELARAAACYATPSASRQLAYTGAYADPRPVGWPWHPSWWKPTSDRVRELVKAGALIAAEIDRHLRSVSVGPAEAAEPARPVPDELADMYRARPGLAEALGMYIPDPAEAARAGSDTTTPEPTARDPWTVTLCWTPDQNFGAVAVHPCRAPFRAVLGLLRAGETPAVVAAEFGLTVQEATVLARLADDLAPEPDPRDTTAPDPAALGRAAAQAVSAWDRIGGTESMPVAMAALRAALAGSATPNEETPDAR